MRARLLAAWAVPVWLGCAVSANATVIGVPANQPTIQAGINSATDGDTILVAAGDYAENINFTGKGICLIGDGGATVTRLTPANPATTTILMTTGEGSGALLQGFTIIGGAGPSVIQLNNGATPVIRDNVFRDFLSYVQNAVSIHCDNSDPLITGNLFYNNVSIGCVGIFTGTAHITNNTFDGNTRGFWSIDGNGFATNNIVTNSAGFGIARSFTTQDYNCVWNNNPNYAEGAVPGTHSISANPLYCDPPAEDYSLAGISPCLGSGETGVNMGAFGEGCGEPDPVPPEVLAVTVDTTGDMLHVVSPTPIIAWKYADAQSRPQASAEIEVGDDNDWTVAERWDPPVFAGSDTSVVYDGATLKVLHYYWARVRVSNGPLWSAWESVLFRINYRPDAPFPLYPVGQAVIPGACTELIVRNTLDLNDNTLEYQFEVYADAGLTSLFASDSGVAEGSSQSLSRVFSGFTASAEYWWRCRASDGFEMSDWSNPESFITGAGNRLIRVPVDEPTIQAGLDAATCDGDTVLVASGTYTENITFPEKAIHLIGEAGAEATTLQPADPSQSTVSIQTGVGLVPELTGFTFVGGSGSSVIELGGGVEPMIQKNVFHDFVSYVQNAVVIRSWDSDPLISYNLFYDNISIGCVGVFSGSARIINNTFDRNTRGFWTISGLGIAKNNIVTNSEGYGIAKPFTELDYNCVWGNHPDYDLDAAPGPNSISVNPLFCNPVDADYTVTGNSPCLGAGENGADIGAYGAACDPAGLNSVRVVSKTVPAGATGVTIPVFLNNSSALSALDIPLVIREITPGSYITSLILSYGDRLPENGPLSDAVIKRTYAQQDGTCAPGGFGTVALPDFVPPDAALFQRARILSDPLSPGYDYNGSLILSVGVTNVPGTFEIDTTCIDPFHHLAYIEDGSSILSTPSFTKGTITIDTPVEPGPNHVIVESKVVSAGSSASIGIYLANDVPLRAFNIPLVLRSLAPGVYPQSMSASYPPGSRLDGYLNEVVTLDEYDLENGNCKSGAAGGFGSSGIAGLTSPDAYKFGRIRIVGPDWPVGDDGGIPSMKISFSAPTTTGYFEIDTTCVDPAGHLAFLNSAAQAIDNVTFAKGLIGISPCTCPRQADFDEDGFTSAIDLASLIDILFAGSPNVQDPYCPIPRGDFDCDRFSTAIDLSQLIDYLFAGGAEACNPCGQ